MAELTLVKRFVKPKISETRFVNEYYELETDAFAKLYTKEFVVKFSEPMKTFVVKTSGKNIYGSKTYDGDNLITAPELENKEIKVFEEYVWVDYFRTLYGVNHKITLRAKSPTEFFVLIETDKQRGNMALLLDYYLDLTITGTS